MILFFLPSSSFLLPSSSFLLPTLRFFLIFVASLPFVSLFSPFGGSVDAKLIAWIEIAYTPTTTKDNAEYFGKGTSPLYHRKNHRKARNYKSLYSLLPTVDRRRIRKESVSSLLASFSRLTSHGSPPFLRLSHSTLAQVERVLFATTSNSQTTQCGLNCNTHLEHPRHQQALCSLKLAFVSPSPTYDYKIVRKRTVLYHALRCL